MNDNKVVNGDAAVSGNVTVGGDALVRGNMTVEHGMKVKGWLDVDNMNFPAAGVFESLADLEAAVAPKAGRIAGVITNSDTVPYVIELYAANGTAWVDTGRTLDVSVKMILHTNIEVLDPEEFAEWQDSVDEELQQKADLADLTIQGGARGVAVIQLKPNVSVEVVTPAGIEYKLDKPTRFVTGNLVTLDTLGDITDSGIKTADVVQKDDIVVQALPDARADVKVKGTTIATVLQKLGFGTNKPTAGTFLTTDGVGDIVGSGWAPQAFFDISGLAMGMAVLATYMIESEGDYAVLNEGTPVSMIKDDNGKVYLGAENIHFDAGYHTVAIIFPDPAEIPGGAFFNIGELHQVHIPSWVHSIGNAAFHGTGLKEVICEGMTPPELGSDVFDSPGDMTLKVHKIVDGEYAVRATWEDFGNRKNFKQNR